MPQAQTLTQDDKYGLEPAGVPAAGGVTDDQYGLEPANAPAEPEAKRPTKSEDVNLPGGTERLKQAVTSGKAPFIPPTKFEEQNKGEPYYGFTPSHMASEGWRGLKELGGGLYHMGGDILFPEGDTEGEKLNWLANKYVFNPADIEAEKARTAATPSESIGHSIASAIPIVGPWAASLGEQAGASDVGGAASRAVAQVGAAEVAKPVAGALAKRLPSKGDVGLALRTETGALKPRVSAASRLAGAMLGSGTGIPHLSELGGFFLGPSIANMVIPDRPFDIPTRGNEPGAPLPAPEPFYEQKAQDLVRRGKEQEALDRAAARPVKVAPMSPITLPPELQGTSTLSAGAGGPAAPLPEARGTPQAPPIVRTRAEVASAAKPKAPTIITPEPTETGAPQPTIESEGRPATWDDQSVMDLAAKGNRAAIAQVGVRQLAKKFPDDPRLQNIRYVMGDVDYRNLITSPREVTKFTPEGQPIRQEVPEPIGPPMDRIARASRERTAPAPEPGPGTIPLNFEQATPVPSWKPLLQHPEPVAQMERPAEAPASFRAGVEPPEGVLPGMAEHVAAQKEGAARVQAEELAREMNRPANIEGAAGEMERLSPLFRGTAASPQGELLKPLGAVGQVAPMAKPVTEVPFEVPEETAESREPGADEGEEAEEAHIEGITAPVKSKASIAKESSVPNIEKLYSREEIEDARGMIAAEVNAMLSADKPGVYFDESEEGNRVLTGNQRTGVDRMGGSWRGVKSGRDMYPFMRENPKWGPEQLKKALRNEDSALYKRAIDKAVQIIRREKENPSVGRAVMRKRLGIEEEPPTEQ